MAKRGLTKDQVEHQARLANLPISTNELPDLQEQLSEVVEYIGKISKAEDPTSRKAPWGKQKAEVGQVGVVRKDEVEGKRTLSLEAATSQAKQVQNGMFVVKAILEEV